MPMTAHGAFHSRPEKENYDAPFFPQVVVYCLLSIKNGCFRPLPTSTRVIIGKTSIESELNNFN